MSELWAGLLTFALLAGMLAVTYFVLGDYMFRQLTSKKHLRVERGLYKAIGVQPDSDQTWSTYLRSVLAFSLVGLLLLYGILRLQHYLFMSLGFPNVSPALAWNTAASFLTNTNWQNYSGESTMGFFAQMAGLAVQNFLSAAVGIAVAIALVRGFMRNRTDRIGNFWVDLTRVTIRVLLPLAFIAAIVLIAQGVIQNFDVFHTVNTLVGGKQTMLGGPVASQEAIKQLGTNGGGFFNANTGHPFEGPTALSIFLSIYLLLAIPFALPRTFGRMVGDNKQGYAIVAAMTLIWVSLVGAVVAFESAHKGTALQLAGAAMEGKEARVGVPLSAMYTVSTTLTSTGAVTSSHDSMTALGGGGGLVSMMTGEVAPGGTGSGLYGMLIVAIIAVFLAGLMVGRTPEFLGKKIQAREIKLASLYILTTPFAILVATGISVVLPSAVAVATNAPGPHGLTEILYGFTSMGNNNGSAFAGLGSNTGWYNVVGGLVMLVARFLPIVFVVALAGSLARQQPVPVSAGTFNTRGPLFVVLLIGTIVIVAALTYFPALALGPLAEALH
jgi:K+-transporting ATPase ATPase A chain